MMDYNNIFVPPGMAFMNDAESNVKDNFDNLSDDEKREYIERHLSHLSDKELDRMTASLRDGEEQDSGRTAGNHKNDGRESNNPYGIFRGPGIG